MVVDKGRGFIILQDSLFRQKIFLDHRMDSVFRIFNGVSGKCNHILLSCVAKPTRNVVYFQGDTQVRSMTALTSTTISYGRGTISMMDNHEVEIIVNRCSRYVRIFVNVWREELKI